MKIIELQATTGYSGLNIPIRGTYTTQRAYEILSEKAFDIYKRKIEAEPRLSEFALRLCIWEKKTDKDGIFHLVKTTYRDFRLVDGKVTLQEEQIF